MLMYYDAIGTYLERPCLEPISFVRSEEHTSELQSP